MTIKGAWAEALKRHLGDLRSRALVLLHDAACIVIAWLLAYWLRFNLGAIPDRFLSQALLLLPLVFAVQFGAQYVFGLHRGLWRFTSVADLERMFKGVVVGTLLIAISVFLWTRLQYVPRSVFPLYALILLVSLGGSRLLYRLAKDRHFSARAHSRVLVVGAGVAGEHLVRDLLRNTPRRYDPVGFVDDDRGKSGKDIHGIRVIGGCELIPTVCARYEVDLILLAVPSATAAQMQRIVAYCDQAGVQYRTLPHINDLVSGYVGIREFRPVEIEDLLGRDPVSLDWEGIRGALSGQRVLVTGGGGSIGAELCRQLARMRPQTLIIYERSEYNLYSIELELSQAFPGVTLVPILGDVCDTGLLEHAFATWRPQVVFHAAAYKHVPLLEEQAREAVRNNVIGTRVVADTAIRHACDAFVLISTDKAVNPANVMGASKRASELYCQAVGVGCGTRFVTVRFGNVLGSAGSVVPLFRQQIERGGPVTVTHPDITRYFMTISEACQLILQASVLGRGGEIYVLDMGEPIRVAYLAEQMIRLSGRVPGKDIEIVYTGLRPGEKLVEELFHADEHLSDTGYDKILLAHGRPADPGAIIAAVDAMEGACADYHIDAVEHALSRLVPELGASREIEVPALPRVVTGAGT